MNPAQLAQAVAAAIATAVDAGALPVGMASEITLDRPPSGELGDYATPVALQLAAQAGQPSRVVAARLAPFIADLAGISSVQIAGPGFLNITLDPAVAAAVVGEIVTAGAGYGTTDGSASGEFLTAALREGRQIRLTDPVGASVSMTAAELMSAIGPEAARFASLRCPAAAPVDLELASWTAVTCDNPVFTVQYAHARSCRRLGQAADLGIELGDRYDPALLAGPVEQDLISRLAGYPGVLAAAVDLREPHRLIRYLEALAADVHRLCDQPPAVADESETAVAIARLWLVAAARQVLSNGLAIVGVSAPERM